VVEWGRLLSG